MIMRILAAAGLLIAWTSFYASPANAAFCGYNGYIKTVDDYAYTQQVSGSSCSRIGARHQYDPVWSNSNYWTSWKYSTGKYVASTPTAEIFKGGHSGTI
jgi:hypothetical protein